MEKTMPRTKETAKAMKKAAGAALKGAGKAKATATTEIDRQKAAKKKYKSLSPAQKSKISKAMGAGSLKGSGAVSEKEMKMLRQKAPRIEPRPHMREIDEIRDWKRVTEMKPRSKPTRPSTKKRPKSGGIKRKTRRGGY
jgi:hypothetical protein